MTRGTRWLAVLGPGLLWAGAAVGVSHLVQSTQAGARFGFALISMVVLANLLKYPFFEFAPRYAAATGRTLLTGYWQLGRWAFYLYLALTLVTMFIIQAVVTLVTGGLVQFLFGLDAGLPAICLVVMLLCALLLWTGRYAVLDRVVKVTVILLTLATVAATLLAFGKNIQAPVNPGADVFQTLDPLAFLSNPAALAFLIPLIGWMPSAIDISVWSSLWTLEKRAADPDATTLRKSLFDFNVGYIGTVLIALSFLALGALMMFGADKDFSTMKAVGFSREIIAMYTGSIGAWSKYLVGFAALATMFSTTLTCIDAYSRVWARAGSILRHGHEQRERGYALAMVLVVFGAFFTIQRILAHSQSLALLVNIATTVSFLTAPVLGYLNFRVVLSDDMPPDARPGRALRGLAIAGLIFLSTFSVVYLIQKIV